MQTQAVQEWTEAVWVLCRRKDAEVSQVYLEPCVCWGLRDSGLSSRSGLPPMGPENKTGVRWKKQVWDSRQDAWLG